MKFLIIIFISGILLYCFDTSPQFVFIIIDLIFCYYLLTFFSSKLRYLFLIHPIILWGAAYSYDAPFLQLGDGPAYIDTIRHYYHANNDLISIVKGVVAHMGPLGAVVQLNFAITPVILVPEWLFQSPSDEIYFLWQTTFSIILIAACTALAVHWQSIPEKYLFYIILYAVISPSFFELRGTLNRYGLLFFGILLFYVSFRALDLKFSAARILGFFSSIIIITITKFTLLAPLLIFCFYCLLRERRHYGLFGLSTLVLCIMTWFFYDSTKFFEMFNRYRYISTTGGGAFAFLAQSFLLGYPFKLLFALLSPFPWHKASLLINSIYKGNIFIFFMHVGSALFGVYFFSRMFLQRKVLFFIDADLSRCLLFGLMMASSIFIGAIGHHAYLLIYFPFFAAMFATNEGKISRLIPFGLIFFVESTLFCIQKISYLY
jgi:hypothetical protein